MKHQLTVTSGTKLKSVFLHKSGVYFDPIGDEFFILKFLTAAPCLTGQIVPVVRVEFWDETKSGATVANGHEIYLGPL